MIGRLDDIDKKDTIDRTELNRRLGMRFDKEVNNRTRSINQMVGLYRVCDTDCCNKGGN